MSPVKGESLAQWFDAGYVQDSGNGNVCRRKALPKGYTGAEGEKLFVKTKVNGVVVWPVRLDLGAMPDDEKSLKSTTCTLYHYTHAKSIAACAKNFSEAAEEPVKESALRLLLQLMREDCTSRSNITYACNPQNPHAGKLLMTPLEPAQFDTQAAVLQGIFGSTPSEKDLVLSLAGDEVPAGDIAKCCIAVRVPIALCSSANLSGSQSEVVLVNGSRLDRELKRLITKREQQIEKDALASVEKKKCCFPWPFGRKVEQNRSRSKSLFGRKVEQNRSRSKSCEAKESKADVQPLINKRLQDPNEIIRQKRRAVRVKQLEAEFQEGLTSRVQSQNRHDDLINAVRENNAARRARSKSRGASQERRLSIVSAGSNGSADRKEKKSKMGLDLNDIILKSDSSNQQTENDSVNRIERSEYSATMKRKGSWKQLSQRQAASQMQ